MENRGLLYRVVPILLAVVVIAFRYCSSEKVTNEAGRTTHVALSSQEEANLGLQSYQQVLSESQTVTSGPEFEMVKRVAQRIEGGIGSSAKGFQWAVSLVQDKQANAFCLPGGKIVVFTGIVPVAQDEAGLATVIGHETAHAVARHGSERLFRERAAQTFLTGVQFSVSDMSYQNQQWILSALGAGAKYGVMLPWGREQESEADHLGLLYMARAGYDPHEALKFWERMEKSGGSSAPEWLSTHPGHETRIEALKKLMPEAEAEYQKAKR